MNSAHRWFLLAVVGLGLLLPLPLLAQGHGGYPTRPGEVLLKLKRGASAHDHDVILTDLGATNVTPLPSIGAEKLRITKRSVDEAIARYHGHPKVEFIEPNYLYKTVTVPNDPEFPRLWGLLNTGQTGGIPGADIDATLAWNVSTGSNDVVIAITDTGIDWTHPDLAANVFINTHEIPNNGIDDDHNGYVDDVRGWDFVNHDNNPMDDHFHGTHVSGTIGAIGNNGIGVAGVNWHVKLLACKFLDAGGSGSTDDAVTAINYAVMMGARVINASWGGGGPSEALRLAIQAAGDAGVVFVAAAGNASQNNDFNPNYPSNFDLPNIVAVAATDDADRLAGFSNYGRTTVDLAAPGVNVYSTLPAAGYGYLSGTSMATPHVSGALGLIFARFPTIGALDAKALLLNSVDAVPSLTGLVLTNGRLNAFTPILEPDSIAPGPIVDLAAVDPNGTRVTLHWTATGDDGATGTARRYEVRYSTAPIDAANFAAAALAAGAPTPSAGGQPETMQVTGLEFVRTYFFAVKAFDELGNASPISNLATATTLPPPDIAVTPDAIQADLVNGQTATRVIHVTNSGPSELHLRIDLQAASTSTTVPIGPRLIRAFARPAPTTTASSATAATASSGSYPSSVAPYDQGRAPLRAAYGLDSLRVANILSGSLRLLVLYTGDVSEIRSLLAGFPDIALVDLYNAGLGTPTLAQLAAYDVVMVAANVSFADPTAAGNVLANYVDLGGGVVLTLASFISGWNLQGRFLTGGYSPFPPGSGPIGASTLGSFDATHPIMAGVTAAQGASLGDVQLASGSELVASWSNGEPMVATKGRVAAINVFVASSGFWTGDIPLILHNAAFWSVGGANWLKIDHDAAIVPSGGALDVVATLDASDLDGGDYERWIVFTSDDPDESSITVPARLHVTGTPDIVVEGEPVTVESAVDYSVDGAQTSHRLVLSSPPVAGAGGTLELIADGDYGDQPETATAIAEGSVLGSVGRTGSDCTAATGSFPLSAAQLATLAADGVVQVDVQNTIDVGAFCSVNRHTVRLRYGTPPDQLAFGTLFVGASRPLSLIVRNRGSAMLTVSSITSDRGDFVPGSTSLSIAPRQSQTLVVTFHPGGAGAFTGTLRLESNDPDLPVVTVALSGTGVNPPVAGVDPTSLVSTLLEGSQETQNLRLLNTGESPLQYAIQLLPASGAFQVVPFAGLSSSGPSNNPPPAGGATTGATSGEPRFAAASAKLGALHSSPAPLTCVVGDPSTGFVYAQANQGTAFYRYRAAADVWERLSDAPLFSGNNGGAALLNGRIYTSYTGNTTQIGVYDVASNTWSTVFRPAGDGTGNIASDGAQYLYLVVGFRFWRYEPAASSWAELIGPPFPFESWGGLQHLDGRLYGHQGNGLQRFAVFDIKTNAWTELPSVPGGTVLGSAVDPGLRKYYAYGSYGGANLYQYSIDAGAWSVSSNPFFTVSDGGLAWLSGAQDGIYFVQGETGTGFARLLEKPDFLTVTPDSGLVPPHGAVDLGVHFTTGDLVGGTYRAAISISSNDPVRPLLSVPATLTVIGVPRLALEPDPIEVSSSATFLTNGARTTHRLRLPIPVIPGSAGTLELLAEGDYVSFQETATLSAEGRTFPSLGGSGLPCGQVDGVFTLAPSTLDSLAQDQVVMAQVQNSPAVDPFCLNNRHTLILRYPGPSDRLAFGSVFLGSSRDQVVDVRNLGSAPLVISAITCDLPQFTTSVSSTTVAPRSSMLLTVTFHPATAQPYVGTLRITSNDPAAPVVTMPLGGSGLVPPDIDVAPAALDAALFTGETTSQTLTVQNRGGSDLAFDVSVEDAPVAVTQHAAQTTIKGQADTRRGDAVVQDHGGPDAFGHRWIDNSEPGGPVFSWVEISGTGTVVPASGDDWNYGAVPIGFEFPYFGASFSSFYVCSNGFISFTSSSSQYSNQPLPSQFAPENLLAVFWADLYTPPGTVFYQNDGSRLIVEWRNVSYLGNPTIPFTFEVLLYPDGRVVTQYLNMHGTQTIGTVGIQDASRSDGLTVSFNTPYVRDGLAVAIATQPPFLTVTPVSGVIAAGGRLDLAARFNAAGMMGGDYQKNVLIRSNDPDESPVLVPTHLHVTGAPDIALSASALDYGTLFIGLAKAETLLVSNVGTDALVVSAIGSSRPEYGVSESSFTLAPGAARQVIVTFRPNAAGPLSGTLTIQSNDRDEPELHVALSGIGQVPPDVAVTPTSLEAALFTGQKVTQTLTLQNTGGSDLQFTVISANDSSGPVAPAAGAIQPDRLITRGDPRTGQGAAQPSSPGPLALVVPRPHLQAGSVLVIADGGTQDDVNAVLSGAGYSVTQVVDDAVWNGSNPSPTGFQAVVLLDGIDYGDDMPPGGQQALLDYVSHGGGLIVTEWIAFEMLSGRYQSIQPLVPLTRTDGASGSFTFDVVRNHPVTTGVGSSFSVLTALSPGIANSGSVLVERRGDHSAMVIAKDYGFGHIVEMGTAGNYGGLRPFLAPDMQRLLVNAADWVSGAQWLSVEPGSGVVPAGGHLDLAARFDAAGLIGGDYRRNVVILSNDPDESVVPVPAHLHVTGAPDIALSTDALDFGTLFTGAARAETLMVENVGTDVLTVTSLTSSRAEYEVDPASANGFSLAPRASRTVMVTFRPTVAGPVAAVLTVLSNDPDEAELHLALNGIGLVPPDIALAPAAIHEDLLVGQKSVRALTIANDGGAPLDVQLGLRLPTMAATVAAVREVPRPTAPTATPLNEGAKALHLESYQASAASRGAPAAKTLSGAGWRSGLSARTRSLFPNAAKPSGAPISGRSTAQDFPSPPGAFILFADDMESGPGGWTHYATSGTDQWGRVTTRSTSGSYSWNVSQHASQGSDALQSPPIDLRLALDALLQFNHLYQFDDCGDLTFDPDGAIVEVAVDDTSSWQQIFPFGGYPYRLDDVCGNPLAGYQAYSHSSGGFFAVGTFDLTPFVGHTVRLRFRAGWDCGNCALNEGWYIDDVVVYSRGPSWVTVAPSHVVVDPHSQTTVNLSFDATGVDVGRQDAQLVATSNDPDEPSVVVPVDLQVADIAAVVNIDPDAVNLGRRGNWVTAYLELPPSLDLNQLVLPTLRLNRASSADLVHHTIGDVDHDGIPDMTLKFVQDDLTPTLPEGDQVPVILSGELAGNHRVLAQGVVRVIHHQVTSPNGGETLTPGSAYSIGWNVPVGWQPDHADLYLSVNGGVSWSLIGAGVGGSSYAWTVPGGSTDQALVRVLLFDALGLITHDSSDQPFHIRARSTSVATTELGGPQRLFQNAPNPFHAGDGTTIAFELPSASSVRLVVYDAAGHLVRSIAEEWMTAGRHQAIWDGRDRRGHAVPSGVYFYQLWDGRERLTRRMVLIR